jgi:hypothetical protein
VHDRRVDGKTVSFGNAGGLYMRGMTWWDHKTISIWSQPIGEALAGKMEGKKLDLLPSQVTTWANWKSAYPHTFVMINDSEMHTGKLQRFNEDFVIGVVIDKLAKAYVYQDVEWEGIIHDKIGDFPVLVWAEEGDFRVYLRKVGDLELTFAVIENQLIDENTGTFWDIRLGLAKEGELKGSVLQPLPSLTSFDWAWEDFYPNSDFYNQK